MASPLGHSLAGVVIYLATVKSSEWFRRWRWLLLVVIFSALADIDYFPALFGQLDTANEVHRGVTHSLVFAVGATALYLGIAAALKRRVIRRCALVLFGACLIHLTIDVLGEDCRAPYGIPLFYPFSDVYVTFPLPIFPSLQKATYGDILSLRNVRVALFEIVLFGIIATVIVGTRLLLERRRRLYAQG